MELSNTKPHSTATRNKMKDAPSNEICITNLITVNFCDMFN